MHTDRLAARTVRRLRRPGQGATQKGSAMRRACLLLLLATLLVTSPCLAQSRRSPDTISMLGNWRIDLIKDNRSLQLVGLVTEGKGAYFAVQCFADGDHLTIVVPTF